MSARRRVSAAVAAVGLVLTACGSSGDDATATATVAATSPSGDVAQAAPESEAVMVPTADGTDLDFNSLRGQDVLLWFWAPW
jgi:hypothetical protein